MKKGVFEDLRKESLYLLIIFIIGLIILKIAFYKENFIILIRTALSLFWLFALPGYFITFYWKEKLEFIERFVIGIILAAGIIGIFSYYIGLIGLNIKYHVVLLPLFFILIGIINILRK